MIDYQLIYNKIRERSRIDKEVSIIHRSLQNYHYKTVHDCSCGDCQHIFELNKLGYQVSGSDINPQMIAYSKKKFNDNIHQINLFFCDFRELNKKLNYNNFIKSI